MLWVWVVWRLELVGGFGESVLGLGWWLMLSIRRSLCRPSEKSPSCSEVGGTARGVTLFQRVLHSGVGSYTGSRGRNRCVLSSRLRDCFQNLPAGGRCKADYRVTIYLPRWAALPITSIFGPVPTTLTACVLGLEAALLSSKPRGAAKCLGS